MTQGWTRPGNVAASGIPVSSTAPYLIEPTSILINFVTKYGESRQEICDSGPPHACAKAGRHGRQLVSQSAPTGGHTQSQIVRPISERLCADPSGRGYVRDLQAEFHSRRGRVGRNGA